MVKKLTILVVAVLCMGMKCNPDPSVPQPTPTPTVAPTATPSPVPTPTPWASFPVDGTAAYFCTGGWEPPAQLAGYCASWSSHVRIDPWDFMRGPLADADRVTTMAGADAYLDQATRVLGKRLIVGLVWTPGLTPTQGLIAGESARKPEIVKTDFGYYGKVLHGPGRTLGFSFAGDAMVCSDPQAPAILARYVPYKDKVDMVEVVDEPNYTRDEMSCVLASVDASLIQVGIPLLPRMVMFTKDQLQYGDAWRALDPQRDVLGWENYVDPAMTTEAQIRAQIRADFFFQYRLTAPYKIQIAGDGYTRNYDVTDTRVIRIAQDETTKCIQEVRADKRIVMVVWFSYMRASGIRWEIDNAGTQHMLDGAECLRWTLDGHPERCAPVPSLPGAPPPPAPDAQGIVGWVENNKGAAREGDPITLYLYRTGAGSRAGLCTVAYTVESARGTNISPSSGVATLDGPDAVFPITLQRPADPNPTGYAQAIVRLGAATGCTAEKGLGRGTWPDDQKSITWMTTSAVKGSGLTLVRFGPTDEPVRVTTDCWGVVVFERGVATLFRNTPDPMTCTITSAPGYTIVDPTAVVK
jgi:hypothetical protein